MFDRKIFYHGTSTCCLRGERQVLLPPCLTGFVTEAERRKNLDRVFFTLDYGYAQVYAGRTCAIIGGEPVVVRVIVFDSDDVVCLSDRPGATVFHAPMAFFEYI